ncbi:uncharacterized protein LOC143082623 [Mytilus galloprovincialis]|uniref:uncharacterized protein LOC143082623 n=1 Tax=Mytilus galloprovincialis TaxID=29158 RepID=UPI003F7C9937
MMDFVLTSLYVMTVFCCTMISEADVQKCPFPPQCDCHTFGVLQEYCQDKGFTEVPTLRASFYNGTWFVDLSDNKITSLTANAFKYIKLDTLWISNNNIIYIDIEAFSGSEDTLQSLHLRGNQLLSLPITLTRLSRFSDLQVQYNPMKDLDTDILMNVSTNLKKLSFGSINMTKWPTCIMNLNKLEELSVYNVSMDSFPINAFEGLEDSLMFLQIQSTNISRLPMSINKLSKLFTVLINYNVNLKVLPEEIFEGLNNIHYIVIQGNAFTNISAIYKDSTNIKSFALQSDYISNITDAVYPAKMQPNLYEISLVLPKLYNVPKSLSNMPSLKQIEMFQANISIIRAGDFSNLPSLITLELSSNPISVVEIGAFATTRSLQVLNLRYTKLKTVPEAIKKTKLYSIDLTGSNVICTCEGLGWMKQWPTRNSTFISGECTNLNIPIYEFLLKYIPKC